jgi:hypothetical protein
MHEIILIEIRNIVLKEQNNHPIVSKFSTILFSNDLKLNKSNTKLLALENT